MKLIPRIYYLIFNASSDICSYKQQNNPFLTNNAAEREARDLQVAHLDRTIAPKFMYSIEMLHCRTAAALYIESTHHCPSPLHFR